MRVTKVMPGGLLSPTACDLNLHCGFELGLTTKPCVTLANDCFARSNIPLFSRCVGTNVRLFYIVTPEHLVT